MFGKVVLVIILLVVLGIAGTCAAGYFQGKAEEPPSLSNATYAVQTLSRVYYTNDYEWRGDTLILHGYWTLKKDRWVYYGSTLVLTSAFGEREVIRR